MFKKLLGTHNFCDYVSLLRFITAKYRAKSLSVAHVSAVLQYQFLASILSICANGKPMIRVAYSSLLSKAVCNFCTTMRSLFTKMLLWKLLLTLRAKLTRTLSSRFIALYHNPRRKAFRLRVIKFLILRTLPEAECDALSNTDRNKLELLTSIAPLAINY